MSSAREHILGRVRTALGHSADAQRRVEPMAVDPAVVRQVGGQSLDENWALFAERLAALGDTAVRFASLAGLCAWLREDLAAQQLARGAADADALTALASDAAFAAWAKELSPCADAAALLRAEYAISFADFAIAETGTLGLCAAAGRSRITSLAPDVHYALLPLARLHADLVDALAQQPAPAAAGAVWWITGSSRTADIEGILIRGAHGPRRLVVLGCDFPLQGAL